MDILKTHYEVLGLTPQASTEQIKTSYRALARQYHPDVVARKNQSQTIFLLINQAYRVLSDPERRAEYDKSLFGVPEPELPPSVPTPSKEPEWRGRAVQKMRGELLAPILQEAEAAFMKGDATTARTLCLDILEQDPRHVKALDLLGDTLVRLNKPAEAAVAYRLAVQIEPSPVRQAKLQRVNAPKPSVSPTAPAPAVPPTAVGKPPDAKNSPGLLGRLFGRK